MTTKAKLTIMGCGNSSGVPAAGNRWGDCDPAEPKNSRMRCSAALQTDSSNIIIDTGPDFRMQVNSLNIKRLDAVLYTHSHGDHVNGIDDLRVFRFKQGEKVPVYANKETFDDLGSRFDYIFAGGNHDLYPKIIDKHIIEAKDEHNSMRVGDIDFIPFTQDHGTCTTLGFRFGDSAYSVDMVDIDDKAIATLKGVKNWVVDGGAYHHEGHPVHATIGKIYELNNLIGAKNVYITSLSIQMDYTALCDELRDGYAPAYDGLAINVNL